MSNELKMDKVQAIRNLRQQGWSHRRIARELGVHRSAVKRAIASDEDPKRAIAVTGDRPGPTSRCEAFRDLIVAQPLQG